MLSRFKSTYQLAEVCDYKESDRWLAAVSEFTARGFQAWKVRCAQTFIFKVNLGTIF